MSDAIDQMAENATATKVKAERVVKSVELTDGRVVDFVGKRKLLKTASISDNNFEVTVRLDFSNGETRDFKLKASSPMFAKFAAHGILQKFGDEVAGLEDPEDMVLAIDELSDRLGRGEWGAERARGEGNALAGLSVLARALVEVSGKTAEAIKEFLKTKSNAEKLALRDNPKLKPLIAKIEAEKKATAKPKEKVVIDTDSLLDEIA